MELKEKYGRWIARQNERAGKGLEEPRGSQEACERKIAKIAQMYTNIFCAHLCRLWQKIITKLKGDIKSLMGIDLKTSTSPAGI